MKRNHWDFVSKSKKSFPAIVSGVSYSRHKHMLPTRSTAQKVLLMPGDLHRKLSMLPLNASLCLFLIHLFIHSRGKVRRKKAKEKIDSPKSIWAIVIAHSTKTNPGRIKNATSFFWFPKEENTREKQMGLHSVSILVKKTTKWTRSYTKRKD